MIVIADTSPLNYLILLRHAEVLQSLYGRVIIPKAVARELSSRKSPEQVRDWMQNVPGWLEVRRATGGYDAALEKRDDGEREAIQLAVELKADALILDEDALKRAPT